MQFSILALAGIAAVASAQTFTGATVSPTAAAPAGCQTSYPDTFELSVMTAGNSKAKRAGVEPNALLISLNNGVLTDNKGRIGYIANNYQFQFDFGGQAGQTYNAGFSICSNKSLALGGSAVWYECLSGNFYNIYDDNWAPQCKPAYLQIVDATASGSASSAAATTSAPAAASTTESSASVVSSVTAVTSSAAVASSITDGQIQGGSTSQVVSSSTVLSTITPTPSSTMSTSVAIVTSITDHQIQAPTSTSVTPYTGGAAMPTMAAQMLLAAAGAAAILL